MGPSIRAWALRVQPIPPVTEVIEAPFLLAPEAFRQDGYVTDDDVRTKVARIKALCQDKTVTVFTRGSEAWTVIVDDYIADEYDQWSGPLDELPFNATVHTRLKVVS